MMLILNNEHFASSLGKIVCVGRNYAEHALELGNPITEQPLLFIKPATAAVSMTQPIDFPKHQGSCHYELEVAVLIGCQLTAASPQQAIAAIAGLGLGLDLTLRDVQSELKKNGHPWERAKSFDGACPLSSFIDPQGFDLANLCFSLQRNGHLQQQGCTADMLMAIPELLAEISNHFTLMPGDVVLTGTPVGVGPLASGDTLRLQLMDHLIIDTTVV